MNNDNENNRFTELEHANIALIERLFKEVWNERRIETIDEFLSPNVVTHFEHETITGRKNWEEMFYNTLLKALPNLSVEAKDNIANKDIVVSRWEAKGTFSGELFGVPPSNEPIEFDGMSWTKIIDGKIIESQTSWNMSYLIKQLLSEAHDELEKQVQKRTAELEQKTIGLEESNIALKVLLEQRERDKKELEKNVLFNVNKLVGPSLEKLKKISSDNNQKAYLEVIESNLNQIVSPFAPDLSANLSKLTPAQTQIASLIQQGKTTKEIASFLNLSPSTIAAHRQNIRKKLALTNKGKNLQMALTAI